MSISIFEKIGLLIWKMKNHDKIIQDLEADLEEAQDEIRRLQYELEKLKGEKQ